MTEIRFSLWFLGRCIYSNRCSTYEYGNSRYGGYIWGWIYKFIGGSVFGIALVLVLVAGSDLFTGNTLLSMGWLNGNLTTKQVVRNWTWVYIGNFIGAMFLLWLMYSSNLWLGHGGEVGANAVALAYKKTHLRRVVEACGEEV